MADFKGITSIWRNVREVDLRPFREAALRGVKIALVGMPGAGRHTLAARMRSDPARPGVVTQSPLLIAAPESPQNADPLIAAGSDLVIVVLDATGSDFDRERELVRLWTDAGINVLVFFNKCDLLPGPSALVGLGEPGKNEAQALGPWVNWQAARVLRGSVLDEAFLLQEFVPAVLEALPQQHLALGRGFPLFRVTIARGLINETCFTNAAYSISTGLAEIVPALDIPLNITDMIVLTKSQAFLAYKLGLLLGFSTRWQDYVTEFGGVVGSGFLWRQIARSMVGLIPVWGIVPKVAVAYAGTHVVGQAILGWYLTGRHLSRAQLRALYKQAFTSGKESARAMLAKLPKPHLRRRKSKALPEPASDLDASEASLGVVPAEPAKRRWWWQRLRDRLRRRKPKTLPAPAETRPCASCHKPNAPDANFCQYCGEAFGSTT